jgi:type VI secretion system protein ImpH
VNAESTGGLGHQVDPVTNGISSLMGIDIKRLNESEHLDARSLLFFAGHFVSQTRNSAGLGNLLSEYLGIPVEITQFHGEWLDMEVDDRLQLPNVFGQAQNNILGQDFVIGEKVFCVENRFEVVIGPMRRDEAEKIRPGSERQKALCAIIDLYAGPTYQYDVRYLLRGGYRPDWQTSKELPGLNLGWNTWLPQQGRSPEQDDILITYSVLQS